MRFTTPDDADSRRLDKKVKGNPGLNTKRENISMAELCFDGIQFSSVQFSTKMSP